MLCLLSALVLFFPHAWATAIGLDEAFIKYRLGAFLVFAGSSIWLLTFPFENLYRSSRRKAALRQLTEDEENVLRPFIANSKKTQYFGWTNIPIARSLAAAGVLTETGTTNEHGHPCFKINPWAYAHLLGRPELVGLPKRNSN
jgi:hypothetical protein